MLATTTHHTIFTDMAKVTLAEPKQQPVEEEADLLSLPDLVDEIESEIAAHGGKAKDKAKLKEIMERFNGNQSEFEDYQFFDDGSSYTRNLVATDGRTYALIVLCWSKGKGSPIHDHPGDGCWMSMLKGSLKETHYQAEEQDPSGKAPALKKICENIYCRDDAELSCECGKKGVTCAYIDDAIALHKVENASTTAGAVSLHLYSPPPSICSVWRDEDRADLSCEGRGDCFYSKYGEKC